MPTSMPLATHVLMAPRDDIRQVTIPDISIAPREFVEIVQDSPEVVRLHMFAAWYYHPVDRWNLPKQLCRRINIAWLYGEASDGQTYTYCFPDEVDTPIDRL